MLTAFALSIGAGAFGAILGLGGGIIIVPALTVLLGVDIRHAIGASIIAVIATSCGAGAAYVRDRMANVRVGMFLEPGTTLGALLGALLAGLAPAGALFGAFGCLLAVTAALMWRRAGEALGSTPPAGPLARRLRLEGSLHEGPSGPERRYAVARPALGLAVSAAAGVVSGLLGVGGGILKVPAMTLAMRMPIRAASATSTFMIGVTGAASAGVYYARGDIDPFIAGPVALGVLVGAALGARALPRLRAPVIRAAFTALLLFVSLQMIVRAFQ
jgi:uncharacterized membrane protein YfcA